MTATPRPTAPAPDAEALKRLAAYLTAGQVGELLQLSAKSVYRIAKADPTMPMLKLAGTVRFPHARLLRWLQDREQGSPRLRRVQSAAKAQETGA